MKLVVLGPVLVEGMKLLELVFGPVLVEGKLVSHINCRNVFTIGILCLFD